MSSPRTIELETSELQSTPVRGERPVVLYVINAAWFFRLHRLSIALAASEQGFEVHVAAAPTEESDVDEIRAAGLHFHAIPVRRGSWSLREEFRLLTSLIALYRVVRPQLVHHITIKAVLVGTLAARVVRTRLIVNSFSGLGYVFTATDRWALLRRSAVRLFYRILFAARQVRVIFENSDDKKMFESDGLVRPERATLIRGVGVDVARFSRPLQRSGEPLVVVPARMLWDKGIGEFCEAAAALVARGVGARFALVGGVDPGNPAAIPKSWLDQVHAAHGVEWWGYRKDMPEVYSQADIVCLPSYREGLPTALLEGGASGCALVTTDVPGCREVVQHGKTGLLVPARDPQALATALRELIENRELRERLARQARERIVRSFSARCVESQTIDLYRKGLHGQG